MQFDALPVIESRVHAFPSLHVVGHDAGGSQVSPASTTPLPQLTEQSSSLVESQPLGQQPSPEMHALMEVWLQATLQLLELPVI